MKKLNSILLNIRSIYIYKSDDITFDFQIW